MRKAFVTVGLLALVCLWAGTASAERAQPGFSDEVRGQLVAVKLKVDGINEAQSAGIITADQASQARRRFLAEARGIAQRDITLPELMTVTGDPTADESWAPSWLTFVNVMWVLGIGLLGCGLLGIIIWQLGPFLFEVLASIPKEFWEGLMVVAGLALVYLGTLCGAGGPYVALLGCLMFGAALFIIVKVHRLEKLKPELLFLLSGAVCVVAAILYGSSMIGFVAVACIMSALGFCVIATPLCYCIGFKDDASVGRATAAAFVMLTFYVILEMVGAGNEYVEPFKFGALWLGAFVGYIGLLIASSRWYSNRTNYVLFQVITVAAGIAAIAVGTIFDLTYVAQIGGTFFVLYLVEKTFEIPVQSRISYAWLALIAGGILFGASWLATTYQDVLGPYFLF